MYTDRQTHTRTDTQTDRQTDKQTREPLSKGDSRTGLIAFHIQLPKCNKLVLLTFILFYIQISIDPISI